MDKKFMLLKFIKITLLINFRIAYLLSKCAQVFLAHPKSIRFLPRWIISVKCDKYTIKYKVPWIIFEAKEWLESLLTPDMSVFEWGSGGSTIFISERVRKLISVEHDREWYQVVSQSLKDNNILNCEYLIVEPHPDSRRSSDFNFNDPKAYISSESKYQGLSFESYCRSIDSFPDESFDLVFIDGRARPSCILHAVPKIKSGGFLLLDNSERGNYSVGEDLLKGWERIDFFGVGPIDTYPWQTTVWKKPPSVKVNFAGDKQEGGNQKDVNKKESL